jgi:hypothetical protein
MSQDRQTVFQEELLSVLTDNKDEARKAVQSFLNPEAANDDKAAKQPQIDPSTHSFSVNELARLMSELSAQGFKPNVEHYKSQEAQRSADNDNKPTPLKDPNFLKFAAANDDVHAILAEQLEGLRTEAKKKKGFLTKCFNIRASKNPLEAVLKDVTAFEKYCQKNKISFNDIEGTLEQEHVPSWDQKAGKVISDFRFLVAAIGGAALGLAGNAGGVDILSYAPMLNEIPGLFFKGIPYIALPFISLSIFKAFSEKSLIKEAPTLGRFVGIMGVGIMVGLGVTAAMSGLLPEVDTAALDEAAKAAGNDGETPFSPSQYILHGIVSFAAFAEVYRRTKNALRKDKAKDNQDNDGETPSEPSSVIGKWTGWVRGGLSTTYNMVGGLYKNTLGRAVTFAGDQFSKAAKFVDKAFEHYMNYVGIPAIGIMMTGLINTGGLEKLTEYAGYYAIMGGNIVACIGALGAIAFLQGARREEMGELAKTATTAFSISSSAATMPFTKKSLENMGVDSHIRESVVPLGANFNMMGTAMFLGGTAVCAARIMGLEPTFMETMAAMGMAVATAFGAPGAPGSLIIFLEPVLAKMGLNAVQSAEIYKMVIPGERPLDMSQTALNVTGDQLVALNTEAWEKNEGLRKVIPLTREHPDRLLSVDTPTGP